MPVVFLHGLLGSQQDWADLLAHLQKMPQIRPLTLDLCFHGDSQNIPCNDFASLRTELAQTLKQLIPEQPFWLVGYSLGGRVALDFCLAEATNQLLGVILEGANIGLETAADKQQRWQNDSNWAMRFENEALEKVLLDWYQQPVFADLSPCKRADLVKKRQNNHGGQVAKMLRATSLAKQPFYLQALHKSPKAIHFLIGERDMRFRQLVEKYRLPYQLIEAAGHNAHRDNPTQYAERLLKIVK